MPELRIRPGLPCKGVSLPRAFVGPDWVEVDEESAAYGLTVRLHATNANSPLLLEQKPEPPPPETKAESAPPKPKPKPELPVPLKASEPAADTKPNGAAPTGELVVAGAEGGTESGVAHAEGATDGDDDEPEAVEGEESEVSESEASGTAELATAKLTKAERRALKKAKASEPAADTK